MSKDIFTLISDEVSANYKKFSVIVTIANVIVGVIVMFILIRALLRKEQAL